MYYLFVIDDLGPGGAQRQIVNLAIAFRKLNNDVEVAVYHENNFYERILELHNIRIRKLLVRNPIKRILSFRGFIRKNRFDTIISFSGIPNFLCELAAIPNKRWQLIVNERSADPFILKSFNSKFRRLFHSFADVIVCNSYANRDIIHKTSPHIRKDNIKVIYNMIDLDEWRPDNHYTYKKDGILHLVVAASHRFLKNFIGLLKAVNLLTEEERKRLKVSWFGDKIEPPFYDTSILECQEFIHKNKLEKVVNLYPATYTIYNKMLGADVIGLFSFFEGLPNVICEGMAIGKPIFATAVSDIPLIISDDINGKLCDPDDIQSILKGLRYFLQITEERLAEMGQLNRLRAMELFDRKKISQEYFKLINLMR